MGGSANDNQAITPTYVLDGNAITAPVVNSKRGVYLRGTAVATLRNNKIEETGGTWAEEHPYYGGVAITGKATDDLGTATSPGNNFICNNEGPSSIENQPPGFADALQVHDVRENTDVPIPAQHNWWCNAGTPPKAEEIAGNVDTSNPLTVAP